MQKLIIKIRHASLASAFFTVLLLIGCVQLGESFAAVDASWPLPGNDTIVTEHCQVNSYGTHNGIDIDGPSGAQVTAICDGTVIYNNTWKDIWDAFLVIEHNCGAEKVYAYYGHLNTNSLSGIVKQGDTVGSLRYWPESWGDNTHLHFSASTTLQTSGWGYRSCGTGTFVDPLAYFSFGGSGDPGKVDVSDGVDISPATVTVGENYEISFDLKEFQGGYKDLYGVEVWLQDADGNDIRRIKKWFDPEDTDFSPNETKDYSVSDDSDAPVSSEGWYQIAIKGRVGAEGEDRFTFGVVSGSGGVNPKSFYAEAVATSQPPEGYHDAADCDNVKGWAKDPDTTDPIYIHFYADGPSGTGTFIGSTSANIYRGDLPYFDKNHGFSFPTPESLRDGQVHQIYVYALDDQGGTNPLLTNSPQSIQCTPVNQTPVGIFESADCSTFVGWTKDLDTTDPIYVHFYADGPAGTGTFVGAALADVYRGDLPYDDKNHGFSFAFPDSLNDGVEHQIYAYAIDSGGGENPLLTDSPKTVQCGLTADQFAAVMYVIENVILADDDKEGPNKGWLPAILKILLLAN